MSIDCANSSGGCFSVHLLGGCYVVDPSDRRLRIRSRKARALLAYLATPVGLFHRRDELATLLWPNTPSSRARASLRRALHDLRSCLGAGLQSRGDRVCLQPDMFRTDVERFMRATSVTRVELLGEATTEYTGDFLTRLKVESEYFTRWQLLQRQHLRSRMLVCRAWQSAVDKGLRPSSGNQQEHARAS